MKIRSIHWNAIDFCTSIGMMIILNGIITHHLGSYGYGVYSISFIVNGTLALFDFGISNGITKYISDEFGWKNKHKYISSSVLFYFSITIVCVICFYSFNHFFLGFIKEYTSYPKPMFFITIVNLLAVFYNSIVTAVLISRNNWEFVVKGNIIFKILSFMFSIWVAFECQADVFLFSLGIVIANLLRCLVYSQYTKIYLSMRDFFCYDRAITIEIFKYAKYSFLNAVSGFFFNQLDKILVAKILGVVELGYYSFISQIINFIYSFLGVFLKTKFPLLSRYHNEKNYVSLYRESVYVFKCSILFIMIFCLVGVLCWRPIMHIYIGDIYVEQTFEMAVISFIYLSSRVFELNAFYLLSATSKLKWFSFSTFFISVLFFLFIRNIIGFNGVNGILQFKLIATIATYGCVYVYNILDVRRLYLNDLLFKKNNVDIKI